MKKSDDTGDNNEEGIHWEINSMWRALIVIFIGICSGMLRGLYGVAGVPPMLFALTTNVKKDEFRASVSFAMMFSELVAVVQLLFFEKNFHESDWVEYVSILIGAFVGLGIGNLLSRFFSQESFHILILYLILCGGLVLVSRTNDENGLASKINFFISLTLLIIIAVMAVYWSIKQIWKQKGGRMIKKFRNEYNDVDELPQSSSNNDKAGFQM